MAIRRELDPNGYERPTNIVLCELNDLNKEMKEIAITIGSLLDRFAEMSKRVRECKTAASRQMFNNFIRIGVYPGRIIRFPHSQNPDGLYQVTGMDGEGFFLKQLPYGKEFHISVFEQQSYTDKIKIVKPNSFRIERLRQQIEKEAAENNWQNANTKIPNGDEEYAGNVDEEQQMQPQQPEQ